VRVLIYSHFFLPEPGGVQTQVRLLSEGLIRKGHEVTVVTNTRAERADSGYGFRIVRRPRLGLLWQLLGQADVVELAGPLLLPLILGWLRGKPVIVTHHGFHAVCPNGLLLYEPTETACPGHFMAGRHDQCLLCNAKWGGFTSGKMWLSTFARRWLLARVPVNVTPTRSLGQILQLPRTITILHGLEVKNHFDKAAALEGPPTFLFVGRLVSTKGANTLLEAAQRLKTQGLSFRLAIIGEGSERARLERLASILQLDDCVAFCGYLPDADLDEALDRALAVVVPSLAGEVFGLVVAESMMRECPVIVSDIPAFAEVVDSAGLRFSAGDVEGLAGCMRQLLRSRDLAKTLGAQARKRALELFRGERMVDEHLELYRSLLRHRRAQC
jgi:glycosyltransferase involved in cell wall biosynthesis